MKIRIKKQNKKVLEEAAKNPSDLPDGYYILVDEGQGWVSVSYQRQGGIDVGLQGAVEANDLFSTCSSNVYVIADAGVTLDGFGPMLYDVLIESLSRKGIAVTADRSLVSADAWNVWEYYFNRRKNEFDVIRLDASDNTMSNYFGDDEEKWPFKQLTPKDKSDDCGQMASMEWATGKGDWKTYSDTARLMSVVDNPSKAADWHKQAISHAFITKGQATPTIDELEDKVVFR